MTSWHYVTMLCNCINMRTGKVCILWLKSAVVWWVSFGVFHKVTVYVVPLISFHGMFCPGCGSEKDVAEATYCENCVSEKTTRDLIICYFNRGYPYAAIVGLLAANGVQMCVRTLKRRLRSLGLKRKGSVVDEDHCEVRPTFSLRFKQTMKLHPDVNISSYSSAVLLLNNFHIKTQFSPVL